MHVILLALGIVVTVAGGAMAGFGIANNGFDIGNTMISAGTTAVVGGLIIVGLAAVVRELRAARMPEAREPVRPAVAVPPPAPPVRTGRDAAPEAPAQTPSPPVADLSQVLAEPPAEPAPAPAADKAPPAGDPFAPPSRNDPRRVSPRERGFDAVWAPEPKPAAPTPTPSPPPPPPRAVPEPNRESEAVAIRPPREPQAVSVLKSGVIEGMAYTLYSDGSIEADLPQGMVRFASIDALRRHLAGQG
jgi:hypothetical protein